MTDIKAPISGTKRRNHRSGAALFLRAFLDEPSLIGSVLPSSHRLASALLTPLRARTKPANILEVGAGTGAVTKVIGAELGPEDRLSVCEVQPELVSHLQCDVLTQPMFERPMSEGRIEMLPCPIQEIDGEPRFDFVVAGLPFNAFKLIDAQNALQTIAGVLKPGGIFSYFEYFALRHVKLAAALGTTRRNIRAVSSLMNDHIRRYEFSRQLVWTNLPPAYARHWKFDPEPVRSFESSIRRARP